MGSEDKNAKESDPKVVDNSSYAKNKAYIVGPKSAEFICTYLNQFYSAKTNILINIYFLFQVQLIANCKELR